MNQGTLCLVTLLAATSVSAQTTAPVASALPAAPASAGVESGILSILENITLYGTVDLGIAHLSHGMPSSSYYSSGVPYLISKGSNQSITAVSSNGLGQSKAGLMGSEPIGGGVSVVFKLETGFVPTSGNLVDGEKSMVLNDGKALAAQTQANDSARAGQIFQGAAYAGVSSKQYGTLTFGRQTGLQQDAIAQYDPQQQANAFSPIGYSGVAAGAGDTEDSRLDSAMKYTFGMGPMRLALLHQFGSVGQIQSGADAIDVGADYAGLSVDATYTKVSDAVSATSLSAAQASANPGTLAATVSDNRAAALQARYNTGTVVFYAGYEHIVFANPSHPLTAPASNIGGYILSVLTQTAYGDHRILEISWAGVRYTLIPKLDLTAAYYHYDQNSYKGNGCANSSASSCSGTLNAGSLVADYRFTKHFDAYAGLMYSNVGNGLAAGYLNSADFTQMLGGRFSF
jgi:predicted porin